MEDGCGFKNRYKMNEGRNQRHLIVLLGLYVILLIWSLIKPYDFLLWVCEVIPAVIGTILLIITYRKFKFTQTTYVWWFIAACLMTIGAHYSYSHVPLFDWLKEVLGWNRNNYDKLGHLVQGIVPVLAVRELLVKQVKLKSIFWINLIAFSISLSASAIYEIIEWLSIYVDTRTGDDFLGSQGYVWDAQSDMFMALIGAGLTILLGRKNLKKVLNSTNDHLEVEQPD